MPHATKSFNSFIASSVYCTHRVKPQPPTYTFGVWSAPPPAPLSSILLPWSVKHTLLQRFLCVYIQPKYLTLASCAAWANALLKTCAYEHLHTLAATAKNKNTGSCRERVSKLVLLGEQIQTTTPVPRSTTNKPSHDSVPGAFPATGIAGYRGRVTARRDELFLTTSVRRPPWRAFNLN